MRWVVLFLIVIMGCSEDPVPVTMTGTWDVKLNGNAAGIWRITESDGSISGTYQLTSITDAISGTVSQEGEVAIGGEGYYFRGTVNVDRTEFAGDWVILEDNSSTPSSARKR